MTSPVHEQLRELLTALLAGLALGAALDGAGLLPGGARGGPGRLWTALTALAAFPLLFRLGLRSGAGLQLFFVLAAAGGTCLYYGLIRRLLRGLRSLFPVRKEAEGKVGRSAEADPKKDERITKY